MKLSKLDTDNSNSQTTWSSDDDVLMFNGLQATQAFSSSATTVASGAAASGSPVTASTTKTTTTTTTATTVLADAIAHETNGVLGYAGALAVLQDAAKSAMSATEFSQLTTVAHDLNATGGIASPAYVAQMFDNVVLGNSANAHWNGGSNTASTLGNLSATSSQTQFNELIGKWFLGTDMPGVAPAPGQSGLATAYDAYSLPLFTSAGPKITDVNQGQVGDCWFLAALGETALLDPSLIQHIITSNGNGTYSVEFQVNGKADYVTVDNALSTYTGNVGQYDGSKMEFASSTTSLWVPLIEKAAAQLAEQGVTTGMEYGAGADQYYELNAGAGEGMSLMTGQGYTGYALAGDSSKTLTSLLGTLQSDLSAGSDVLMGTSGAAASGNLVAGHMFAVTGINTSTDMVSLFNPWGANGVGAGKPETFSIAASALVSDQAWIYAATGAIHVS